MLLLLLLLLLLSSSPVRVGHRWGEAYHDRPLAAIDGLPAAPSRAVRLNVSQVLSQVFSARR